MNNEKGFTLIEMMIVMLIISVLLIITIPNIAKHNENINAKGCDAYIKMVEAQVEAYKMEKNTLPKSVADLVAAKYLNDNPPSCTNGKNIVINPDGTVVAKDEPLSTP